MTRQKNAEVVDAKTNIVGETTEISSEATLVTSTNSTTPQYLQKVPINDLGEFLDRFVEIQ